MTLCCVNHTSFVSERICTKWFQWLLFRFDGSSNSK